MNDACAKSETIEGTGSFVQQVNPQPFSTQDMNRTAEIELKNYQVKRKPRWGAVRS